MILLWTAEEEQEGRHQACRYYTTSWDGRHLCLKCGLHYVRRTDLRRKECHGTPQSPKARRALEAADAGEPLPRRAVSSRAAYPSGANLSAAGARHPVHGTAGVRVEPRPRGPRAAEPPHEDLAGAPDDAPAHLGPLSAFGFRVIPAVQLVRGAHERDVPRPNSAPARLRADRCRVVFQGIPAGAQSSSLAASLGAVVRPGAPPRLPRAGSVPAVDREAAQSSTEAPQRPHANLQEVLHRFFRRSGSLEPD